MAVVTSAIGMVLGLAGTYYFGRGWLLNEERVEQLSGTYWGSNTHLRDFLVSTKADAQKGFAMVGAGFLLQFVAMLMQAAR